MRHLAAFLFSVVVFVSVVIGYNAYTENYIRDNYRDNIARQENFVLNQGLVLQKLAAENDDTLLLYGSSEVAYINLNQHPVNFFPKKECRVVAKIVGRGYSESLIHLMNFMAIPQSIKGKKIVFIISLQWFLEKGGLPRNQFDMNFSLLHFYSLMRNGNVPEDAKEYVARRVYYFTRGDKNYESENFFCRIYLSNKTYRKIILGLFKPFYDVMYYILTAKDNFKSYILIKESLKEKAFEADYSNLKETDWKEEMAKADAEGKKLANNNEFFIKNTIYNEWYAKQKNHNIHRYTHINLLDTPEYLDLEAFLKFCKAVHIKPLFVLMPVNGKWYDLEGLHADERKAFYSKIVKIIESYGFEAAQFSDKEYEPYFMFDSDHFGWKGWLYVNEQIVKYCNEN